ncbi:isoleucine--tRNA ligase [archaeon]|nr:isoleucine--tRNA ligase [archaeon]
MSGYDHKNLEKEIQNYWKKEKIAEEITNFGKKDKKKFYLLDGPPYANGLPHAGHVMTIVYKDIWGKLKNMQGFDVWFQPGFDCHGLPIENKVEKEMNITSKKDIENKIGVDKFINRCREFAHENVTDWMTFYKQVAAWKGWVDPYLTYHNTYIESGWWTIKTLYDKGLMVEGKKPIHWCPKCETSVSGYEATDAYKDVTDPSVYIKFPIKGKKNEYFLAWTTTPWTLPANVALIVHPDELYVKVEIMNEKLIFAKALLKTVMEKKKIKDYKILEEFKGKTLENTKYEPLLDIKIQKETNKEESAHKIILSIPMLKNVVASKVQFKKGIDVKCKDASFSHMVTMDTGTGIVHCAPGHGAEDNKIGKHYNLPIISPVNDCGCLTKDTDEFSGIFVKTADKLIIKKLETTNRLFLMDKITHSYPLCWRCKAPLLFRLSNQWFFKINTIKEKMLSENKKTNWLPPFGTDRMKNWVKDEEDWCVSTQRFWGIPIPLWKCNKCNNQKMIESKSQLQKEMSNNIKLDDLHKHVVDKTIIKCDCGGEMKRISDIINIWVESGIAPWASLGYPQNDNGLFKKLWQVDMIDESQDQIRGWFHALLFMGIATFDQTSYKSVSLNGWTLDAKGEKMSKSIGNVVSAKDCMETLGADVLRLYNCYNIAPWETQKFSLEKAKDLFRVMNVLTNMINFVDMYKLKTDIKKTKLTHIEDKWLLSRLNTTIKEVTDDYENFRFHFVGRKLSDFILEDFSRWYMKLAKERFQKSIDEKDANFVIIHTIGEYIKLLAPICPFITEKLYLKLFKTQEKKKSIHMCDFPKTDITKINQTLENEMKIVDKVTEIVHAKRQENGIRLKWPIKKITLSGNNTVKTTTKELNTLLVSLCNTKKVEFEKLKLNLELKPNFPLLGPIFGKNMSQVVALIKKENPEKLQKALINGKTKLGDYEITSDMIIASESLPLNLIGDKFESGVVVLDLTRTKELEEEALISELIRKIQVERKEKGFKIQEKINITIDGSKMLENWKEKLEDGTNSTINLDKVKGKNKKTLEFEKETIEFEF